MAIEFYWSSGSVYAWRAMLGLEVKKLSYESHLLSLSEGGTHTAEHLARNPRGKVPALVDGETVVYESIAILAYLDSKYPEPALFGTRPDETGVIWRLIMEQENYFMPAVFSAVAPVFMGATEGKADQMRAGGEAVAAELEQYNARLADSPWVAGDRLSAADVILYPAVKSIARAEGRVELACFPVAERFPNLAKWQARLEDLPRVDNAYPPHWRE